MHPFIFAALLASAHGCKPITFRISRPSAAITLYSILPKEGDAEDLSGPSFITVTKDGTVWFTLIYRSELGNLRNGKGERCALHSMDAMYRAFSRATGRALVTRDNDLMPADSAGPVIPAKFPKGLGLFEEAVAPNGLTWFTLEEGVWGNPTHAGRLGSIDRAKRLHLYHVPFGQETSIAIDKNGMIWLGDYYDEQVIEVDPTKL